MNKPEESNVVTLAEGSSHGNCHINVLAWLYRRRQIGGLSLELIAVSLNEKSVSGPLEFSSVEESPGLLESFPCLNGMPVTKAFLYKSSLMVNFL